MQIYFGSPKMHRNNIHTMFMTQTYKLIFNFGQKREERKEKKIVGHVIASFHSIETNRKKLSWMKWIELNRIESSVNWYIVNDDIQQFIWYMSSHSIYIDNNNNWRSNSMTTTRIGRLKNEMRKKNQLHSLAVMMMMMMKMCDFFFLLLQQQKNELSSKRLKSIFWSVKKLHVV